jgi:MFS family permease
MNLRVYPERIPLWRNREFLKLWIGQTISEIGSRITREGLPLTAVIVLGATPAQMGILSATGGASVLLFSLWAGLIVDRVRRRPVMIAADLGRALLLAAIPALALMHRLTIAHLITVAACPR